MAITGTFHPLILKLVVMKGSLNNKQMGMIITHIIT